MQQLRVLPPNTNQFEANGVTYTFEDTLSIDRYRMFERFRLEVGFGVSTDELRKILEQNIDFLERFAQGEKVYSQMVALNFNSLKGVVDMTAKEPFAVWMCSLFFNTKEEDRRWFKEEVMREKILNWQEAGIDNSFFIGKACAMIASFASAYEQITQMSLGWQRGENPEGSLDSLDPVPTE